MEAHQAQQQVVQPKPAPVLEAVGRVEPPPISPEQHNVAQDLIGATAQNYDDILAGLSNNTRSERDTTAPEGGQI